MPIYSGSHIGAVRPHRTGRVGRFRVFKLRVDGGRSIRQLAVNTGVGSATIVRYEELDDILKARKKPSILNYDFLEICWNQIHWQPRSYA